MYFSGEGRRPAFASADGVVFNELCYDDFRLNKELSTLQQHIIDDGITQNKATGGWDGALKLSGNVPVISGLSALDLSAKHEITVENLRVLTLTEQGNQIVLDNIGDNCRNEVAALRAQGRDVVMLLAAQRADKITDVVEYRAGIGGNGAASAAAGPASVAVSLPGINTGGGTKQISELTFVYMSGQLATPGI